MIRSRLLVRSLIAVVLAGLILGDRPSVMRASGPIGPSQGALVTIIQRAMPYIHVVNGVALISPSIGGALSSADIAVVSGLVAQFNHLPAAARLNSTPIPNIGGGCSGQSASHWVYQWWGVSYYANECTATTIYNDLSLAAPVTTLAAAFCINAGPAALLCAAAAAAISLAAGLAMFEMNNVDRGHGVWFNWIGFSTGAFPTTITTG